VAIPHCRIASTTDVEALFLHLASPLPFDADDGEPVDLMFALVFPENRTTDQNGLMTKIAAHFSEPELLSDIRAATDANAIWHLLATSHT